MKSFMHIKKIIMLLLIFIFSTVISSCHIGSRPSTSTVYSNTLRTINIKSNITSLNKFQSVNYRAIGIYKDGTIKDITTEVNWSSSNQSVVKITDNGVIHAIAPGLGYIYANKDGIFDSEAIEVKDVMLIGLSINNTESISVPIGTNIIYTAVGYYNDGSENDITDSVSWNSLDQTIATIDKFGKASAIKAGTVVIEATIESMTFHSLLTIRPSNLSRIDISPSEINLPIHTGLQFHALGRYKDDSTFDLTNSVEWTSSAPDSVSINSNGYVVANNTTTSQITASMGNIRSNISNITVTSVTLEKINIMFINNESSILAGFSEQLKAIGQYSDTTSKDLTKLVYWSSSAPSISTIDKDGVLHAIMPGNNTIQAFYNGESSNILFSIVRPPMVQ